MKSEKVVRVSLFLAFAFGLSGCGSSGGVKKLFTEEVIVLSTVYAPEQSLAIVGAPAAYPDDWNSSPDPTSVVKPSLSPLEGSLTSNLGQTLEDGSQTKPFNEASLQWNYLNQPANSSVFQDPNAYVKSRSEELYDLRWGELDANGPSYAANYSVSPYWYQPSSPLTIWGKVVSGSVTTEGPRLVSPGYDVLESWRLGWTGMGKTILVIDDLAGTHGVIVAGIAAQIAPGAQILGKSFTSSPSYQDSLAPLLLDGSDSGLTGTDKVHAVNLSFSPAQTSLRSGMLASSLRDLSGFRFSGVSLSDAVIAVAAGNGTDNDGVPVEVSDTAQPLAWTLLNDGTLQARTLVVGALNVDTATGTKSLASYSNFPGANTSTQSRFLVASGHANWVDGYAAIDGAQEAYASNIGTSYASPRVTAIASIVRQKFPNLSGEQTANVLLSTATYETLGCHPSCSPSLYGQGEVSLRRALAPVGRLK